MKDITLVIGTLICMVCIIQAYVYTSKTVESFFHTKHHHHKTSPHHHHNHVHMYARRSGGIAGGFALGSYHIHHKRVTSPLGHAPAPVPICIPAPVEHKQ